MRTERCPDPADLRRLLDPGLLTDEETWLSRHLDSCARCRESLASLAETNVWRPGHSASPAPVEDALRQVMQVLKEAPRAVGRALAMEADDLILGLLAPIDEPGRLGRLGPYHVTE